MTAHLNGFEGVIEIFDHAYASGNNFPKVRLAFDDDDKPIHMRRTSSGRFEGSVTITDDRGYPTNTFYGRITREGSFDPSRHARDMPRETKLALWTLLKRFQDGDAEAVFAEFGKRFGFCSCCGRPLSNEESVSRGIGPVCAQRWGLNTDAEAA